MVHVILDLKEKARSVVLLLLLCVSPAFGADSVRIEIRSSWTGTWAIAQHDHYHRRQFEVLGEWPSGGRRSCSRSSWGARRASC